MPLAKKHILPILFVTLLIDITSLGMLIPLLPTLFTDPSSPSFLLPGYSVSAQYLLAGLITALFGLMQFLMAPLLGELSDAYGRKRLLALGIGVLAFANLLFGAGIALRSLALLFISRMVAGIAGANFSIAQAVIADVTRPEDRAKNFGLIGAAFGIGFILGPLLGGYLAALFGNAAAPFLVAAGLGIINLLSVSLFLPETHTERPLSRRLHPLQGLKNIQAAFRDRDARPVYFASFSMTAGFAFFTSFVGILLVARYGASEASVGTYFAVSGLWIVFTQGVLLRIITKKYRETSILRFALLVMMAGILIQPFLPSLTLAYALIPLFAVPNGLSMANMTALVSKSVSAKRQGAALGINGSLFALSSGLVPLLAGGASGLFGLAFPFLFGAFLALVSALIIWNLPYRKAYAT
jgi:MFS family permease